MDTGRRFSRSAILLGLMAVCSCGRGARVADETYRQAVTSFYVSLAALQTSQDVLARAELERTIQLVPDEPAAWANLGLLLLRQQQTADAAVRLAKASELAPRNAPIARLVALTESRQGNLQESVRHWRRAVELDPADLKAPYALALELERMGGAEHDAEAQRLLESLAARTGNLAALLEFTRMAAKRADSASLRKALDSLAARSGSWPADARTRLEAARAAAGGGAAAAATPVTFLRNVLIRDPEYRAALTAASTPQSEVGEPLVRFVSLDNPGPQAAPADERLAFASEAPPGLALSGAGASVAWLTGDGPPTLIAAGPVDVRLATGITLPFPGRQPAQSSAPDPPGPDAIAAADLNYDFLTDLVLAGNGGLRIFRQADTGAFADVTSRANVPADVAGAPLHGVWAADVDTDGDLDLLVARRDGPSVVLRNNGDDTFVSQSPFAAVARLRGFAWADINGDGVPDAALMDDQGGVRVFLNLRGSTFREQPVPAAFPRVVAIAAAEISGDGLLDVLGLTSEGDVVRLSWRTEGGTLESTGVTRFDRLARLGVGTARLLIADLDNNAAGDLVAASPTESRVMLSGPDGRFRHLAMPLNLGVTAAADLDGDGRLELVGRTPDGPSIARSSGEKRYHWQVLRPRAATATGDQRINSFGIGGEIEVRTGLHTQKQTIASPAVHFGLGAATRAEVARVAWPNGVLQSEFDVAADTTIPASQRLKGSCPWLFGWNGREMAFVTDFIWRSPLGLRINAQSTADVLMTEDWIKVRGDQLVAREGAYDLRITAELWETHFFDMVSLLVVDHPEGTEAFVDERFAVPPPPLGVVVTSPVRELAAVRDDSGRDVAPTVAARDNRHLDFAGRGAYQGVTRQHFVEIELPDDAPRSGPLWLVGQGWVHPTDSSVNLALSQGTHAAPDGLSLQVADARGRFRAARTGLGFPAGKDKTILIDLEGLFPRSGVRTLRLGTNLEIFWDRLGWAAGRPDVKVTPRRIAMRAADLQFRGYSVTSQADPGTPERPRYELGGVAPRWRDLEGFHTRFGDVRELLDSVDDRYVIMNAGDEIRLVFPEAPPPAAGMTRDFVLVGDGWVKDGDYNTTASRTVQPLPTHQSPQYTPGTGRLEDDPLYLRNLADFERYHTRYVSPDGVRDALRVRIAEAAR